MKQGSSRGSPARWFPQLSRPATRLAGQHVLHAISLPFMTLSQAIACAVLVEGFVLRFGATYVQGMEKKYYAIGEGGSITIRR